MTGEAPGVLGLLGESLREPVRFAVEILDRGDGLVVQRRSEGRGGGLFVGPSGGGGSALLLELGLVAASWSDRPTTWGPAS